MKPRQRRLPLRLQIIQLAGFVATEYQHHAPSHGVGLYHEWAETWQEFADWRRDYARLHRLRCRQPVSRPWALIGGQRGGEGARLGLGDQLARQSDDLAQVVVLPIAVGRQVPQPVSLAQRMRFSHMARRSAG